MWQASDKFFNCERFRDVWALALSFGRWIVYRWAMPKSTHCFHTTHGFMLGSFDIPLQPKVISLTSRICRSRNQWRCYYDLEQPVIYPWLCTRQSFRLARFVEDNYSAHLDYFLGESRCDDPQYAKTTSVNSGRAVWYSRCRWRIG